MRWCKKREANGYWSGPLQVIIQEDQRAVWITQGNKLYRIAPEHPRSLSAVEEWQPGDQSHQELPNVELGQSTIPRHGGTQFHNHIDNLINPNTEAPVQNQFATKSLNHQTSPSHSSQDQPDQEPDETSGPADLSQCSSNAHVEMEMNNAPSAPEPEVPNPVEVPIPVHDSDDELFAEDHDCFALTNDECWKLK